MTVQRFTFVALLALVSGATACGDGKINAPFTSRIVQHEICRVIGDRAETCTREEAAIDLRVRIVELEDDNVWLYGIPRGGVSDRAILGSRDTDDGFVFIDESAQANEGTGCSLVDRLEISIEIDPEAQSEAVSSGDPCVPLVGRETETTTTSAGCDTVNNPPLPTVLTARRRWEPPPTCED